MAKLEDNVRTNRIVYIDPNNAAGHINGTPLTPDYTDFCIWCNLVVERPSRLKNQINGTDQSDTYAMSWESRRSANGNEYVSFFRGEDVDNYNYLTTDYSDIHFNEIKKRNMVEGLQIESVQISMANYTCPHVTIKFIDIRGAGFFGREEATHNEYGKLKDLELDKDGKIMDNIFGGFVTFPYPRFKLQIKGFYGRDVTYQLTCSNFLGTFNSGTGNFEITVQFIGYEYGVLGDIPFDYIVAAPLTNRGNAYWNKQVEIAQTTNSNQWLMSSENGSPEPPFKLYDFYKNVKAAIEEIGDSDEAEILLNDAITTSLNEYDNIEEQLTLIKSYINNLKSAIENAYGKEYITSVSTPDTEMIMIHSQTKNIAVNNEIATTYNALAEAVEALSKKYPELDITPKNIPNSSVNGEWSEWHPGTIEISSFTEYKNNSDDIGTNVLTALDNESNKTSGNIIQDKSSCINVRVKYYNDVQNEELSIKPALSEQIFKNYTTWEWSQRGSNYARYAAVIDFNKITAKVGEALTDLKIKRKDYTEVLRNTKHKTIRDIVGFTPFIGNYFKVVMCHLETFVYLCNDTVSAIYQEIDNGIRKPTNLGIYNLDSETDVPSYSTNQVPPFPAVYRKYSLTAEEIEQRQMSETKDAQFESWVGNFQGPVEWQEKELVDELFLALQDIIVAKGGNGDGAPTRKVNDEIAHFSLVPRDLRRNLPSYAYLSKENMALYTALRAETIFNQLHRGEEVQDDVASKFGAMDAYNLVHQAPSTYKLAQLNKVSSEGEGLADELLGIVTLKNTGRSDTYPFEIAKVTNGRQPVFTESGDEKYNYVYMSNKDKGCIVPMNEYVDFNSDSVTNDYSWVDGKFKVNDINDSAYMFNQNTKDFLNSNGEADTEVDDYLNTQMFDIDSANDHGSMDSKEYMESAIFEQYDKITNGDIPIGTMTGDKIKSLVDEYWLVDSHCLSFYKNSNKNNYKSYQEVLASDTESKICHGVGIPDGVFNITTPEKTAAFIKNFKNKVKL